MPTQGVQGPMWPSPFLTHHCLAHPAPPTFYLFPKHAVPCLFLTHPHSASSPCPGYTFPKFPAGWDPSTILVSDQIAPPYWRVTRSHSPSHSPTLCSSLHLPPFEKNHSFICLNVNPPSLPLGCKRARQGLSCLWRYPRPLRQYMAHSRGSILTKWVNKDYDAFF